MSFTKQYFLDRASGILDAELLSSLTAGTFTFSTAVALGSQSWTMPAGYFAVLTIDDEQIKLSSLSYSVGVVTATLATSGRGFNDTTVATHDALSAVNLHVVAGAFDNLQDYLATLSDTGLIVQNTVTTIVSATSHTIAGDQTAIFKVGRVFVFAVAGVYYRAVITASAYGALTTVTLNGDALPSSGTVTACGFEFATNTNKPIDYSLIKSATNAPTLNAPAGYVWLYSKGDGLLVKDSSGNIRHISTVVTTVTSTAGAVTLDLASSNFFELTLTENVTSITPSNGADGQVYTLRIKQAAGIYTVTLGASFRFNTTVAGYSANQVNGAFDYINFSYNSDTSVHDIRSITTGTQAGIIGGSNSQTLVDGANVSWPLANGTYADLLIGGNRTLSSPSGMTKQQLARLIVYQDVTGNRTLAFGGAYQFNGATPTLSTTPLVADIFDFQSDGLNMYNVAVVKGFGAARAYFAGGNTAGVPAVTTTDGLDFATDTVAQVTKGALSGTRCAMAGVNSVSTGYFAGGSTATSISPISITDGISFSSDTTAQVTKGSLSANRATHGSANSPTIGYFSGGVSSGSTPLGTTDGLTFATDTTTMVTKGVLLVARKTCAGANSSTLGYFSGGDTAAGTSRTTTTDGLTFATDTTAMVSKGVLTVATVELAAGNSATVGYFAGGETGASAATTVNNGLVFSTDTVAMVTKGAMTGGAVRRLAGANSGLAAYFSGGYSNSAVVTATNGLTFSTDTTTMVTKGALSLGRQTLAACQGSTLNIAQIA
jgi:hypothetical protein